MESRKIIERSHNTDRELVRYDEESVRIEDTQDRMASSWLSEEDFKRIMENLDLIEKWPLEERLDPKED
jgi:hypothetical protein